MRLALIRPLHQALASGEVVAVDTGLGVAMFIPRDRYDVALNWKGYHLGVSSPRAGNDAAPIALSPVKP